MYALIKYLVSLTFWSVNSNVEADEMDRTPTLGPSWFIVNFIISKYNKQIIKIVSVADLVLSNVLADLVRERQYTGRSVRRRAHDFIFRGPIGKRTQVLYFNVILKLV